MGTFFKFDADMSSSLTASFFMASALCFHFFGYEMARAASIALLAAKDVGLGSGALSFTVAVGSPISAMVLFLYARSIKRNGPRVTLLVSNIACLLLLGLMSVACGSLKGFWGQSSVLLFFCFREIYVSLLSTQQWSFIASVLDSKTSNYLVTFAGVVSVASAVGGCSVEYLVSLGGVRALLITAFVSCGFSFISAEIATYLARTEEGKSRIHSGLSKFSQQGTKDIIAGTSKNLKDMNITEVKKECDTFLSKNKGDKGEKEGEKEGEKVDPKKVASKGFWRKSLKLLMKHETLQLLFIEALIHQACSNMLNMMFYDGLRTGIPLDSERAVLVGRFFASVNIAACFLQVFVMPHVLSISTLPRVLCAIPMIIFCIVIGGYIYPSLLTIMFGFGALKVLEYSIMTSATEMIYMPMSNEQRYLGKELIRFFGHRMGKSAAVMMLSAASVHFKPSLATQSLWGGVITAMWSGVMFGLSNHLALRNETVIEEKSVFVQESVITHMNHGKNVKDIGTETMKMSSLRVQVKESKVHDPHDDKRSSYDTDTTSESGSDPNSTDSLNVYYMPTEDSERDLSTQDHHGRTLTITPSFTLLSALNDPPIERNIDNVDNKNKSGVDNNDYINTVSTEGGKNKAVRASVNSVQSDQHDETLNGDEDWSDFVVLDNTDDNRFSDDGMDEDERRVNDTFLHGVSLEGIEGDDEEVEGGFDDDENNENSSNNDNNEGNENNEGEDGNDGNYGGERDERERNIDDEGLRKRSPRKIEMKLRKSPYKIRRDKEKKSSDNLIDMTMNTMHTMNTQTSNNNFMNAIRKVTSTVKFPSKKYSDTWMSKINGSENGRPLMFRVGSTCMTMSNLVNENRDRERSSKIDHNK